MEFNKDDCISKFKKSKKHIGNLEKFFVYCLWDNDEIVYIGQSIQLEKRIRDHMNTKKFSHYSEIECSNQIEMDGLESYLIGTLRPLYNKQIGSDYISFQQVRGYIRQLGESYKYNSKYYVNRLKKMAKELKIEIVTMNGIAYIPNLDKFKLIDYALEKGKQNG